MDLSNISPVYAFLNAYADPFLIVWRDRIDC